eukprot:1176330-Prorocentrum_minimum.AAC.1
MVGHPSPHANTRTFEFRIAPDRPIPYTLLKYLAPRLPLRLQSRSRSHLTYPSDRISVPASRPNLAPCPCPPPDAKPGPQSGDSPTPTSTGVLRPLNRAGY